MQPLVNRERELREEYAGRDSLSGLAVRLRVQSRDTSTTMSIAAAVSWRDRSKLPKPGIARLANRLSADKAVLLSESWKRCHRGPC